MTTLLAVDRPIYRVLATWTSLVRATAIWLLLCAPVVTAPAATVGLMQAMHDLVSDQRPSTLRENWQLVREVFWPAFRLGAIALAGTAVVATSLLGPSPGDMWNGILPSIAIPVALMWALTVMWTFAVLAERGDGAWNATRFAYLRVVRRPDLAALCGLGSAAVVAVGVALPSAVWLPFWLTAPALCALIAISTARRAGTSARSANDKKSTGGTS